MVHILKRKSVLAAGVASVAIAGGVSAPAEAAVVNSVSNIQATPILGGCRLSWDVNVTGQAGDALGPTQDGFVAQLTDQAGNIVPGSVSQTAVQTVGVTSTLQVGLDVGIPLGTQRFEKFIVIREAFGPGTGIRAQTPLPDSVLAAAGGFCLNVRENNEPTVDAGSNANADAQGQASLVGTASDLEMDPLTFTWTQVSGPGTATITNGNTLTPSIVAPKTVTPSTYVFQLAANDGFDTSVDTVSVSVPANNSPIANAGTGQTVVQNTTYTLDGSASIDPDGDPLTYQWVQTSGPTVTLANANSAVASFTTGAAPPSDQNITFLLTVNDGLGAVQDTVTFLFTANLPPSVTVGPNQTVAGGSQVTLSAQATDPENDPITPLWTQVSGPPVAFPPQNFSTDFTAPARTAQQQILEFQFVATDSNNNASAPQTVTITVEANQPPTAAITGPTTASGGATIALDGSGSTDPENDPLIYQWTQVSGPAAAITNPGAATTDVTLPAATSSVQTVEFQLLVGDPFDATDTETFTISIAANNTPVADAGQDATVAGGGAVTLDGSGSSDADNDPITYAWTQVSGPSVTLSDPTAASPSFTAPLKTSAAQNLVFELVVSDTVASSTPDQVTITIDANQAPLPEAGPDQRVQGASSVILDATGSSDPDGDPLSYAWTQISGPSVTLDDPTVAQPSFTTPPSTGSVQTLVFSVAVGDGFTDPFLGPPSDTVTITIAANQPPVANAGADQGPIDSGDIVQLDGSGSNDPDSDPLTYAWTQVSGPPITLSDATAVAPSFVAPTVNGTQDIVLQLVVSDGQTSSVADTVTISVRAVGNVTIIQRVIGSDTQVAFTSTIAALNSTIATSGGSGQLTANAVAAGAYQIEAADLSAAGYALTDITCNDNDSTADLTTRTINLALAPNEDLVCTFTLTNSREAASAAIAEFLTGRNALIMAHQPDLQRRLDRLTGSPVSGGSVTALSYSAPGMGRLPFDVSLSASQASASTSLALAQSVLGVKGDAPRAFDLWTELHFSDVRLGAQEGHFRMIYIGADYRIGEDVLIGGLVGFDDFSDDGTLAAGEVEGDGYLAGPYITARLAPQFFVEARAAWGKSDNSISPLGTFTDTFETTRAYYSGSAIGQFDIGKETVIRPELTLRYIRENQASYIDSLSITVPAQTVDQGELSFRPRMSHSVKTDGGWTLRPFGEVEGILTFGEASGAAFPNPVAPGGVLDLGSLRARVEGGLDMFSEGGVRASLAAFHDGIGADNFSNTGVSVGVSFSF